MANTERLNVLQKVVTARNAVGGACNKAGFASRRTSLDEAYRQLVNLQDTLVLAELKDSVGKLRKDSKSLSDLAESMKQSVKGLKKVAELVSDAAAAVGTLADIVAAAAGAGLL
jgi:histidyl-tRNA synthetase